MSSQIHDGTVLDRDAGDLGLDHVTSGPITQVSVGLDRSWSIRHHIGEINRGMRQLVDELSADEYALDGVDLSQYSFGGDVRRDAGPALVRDFQAVTLSAGNGTPLGEAVHTMLDDQEASKERYRYNGTRLKVPSIFGLTDGNPTDEWRTAAQRVRELAAKGELNFFLAYLGDASVETLREICPPDQPPLPLDQTKFKEFFRWMSMSVGAMSRNPAGGAPGLPPVQTWIAR